MKTKEQNITCRCGSDAFSINLDKVESIGLVTCKKCEKNYFLLDSGDYWYDIIQEKYPSKVKCSKCKSEFFSLKLTYQFRENSKDIRCVEITGECKQCRFSKKLGTWEFKYSPTDSLIKNPIIFCQNPKVKYNLSTNTCYWTSKDLVKFLEFLYSLKLSIHSQFHDGKKDVIRELGKTETIKLATRLEYSSFFAYQKKFSIPKDQEVNWKKEEVISVSFPYKMMWGKNLGLLFYIEYTTNYVKDFKSGVVKEKSSEFKEIIEKVESWLKTHYQSLRHKNTFDNLEEHKRLFGNKFLKK